MENDIRRLIRLTLEKDTGSLQVPIEVQRLAWEEAASSVLLPADTVVEQKTIEGIRCERIYSAGTRHDSVILWLHGGGYYSGSCVTHREFAARLAAAASVPVLLVDYRLAPEHPFPAGLEDSLTVYRWLLKEASGSRRIVVGGDSAGGGLALALLLALKAAHDPLPAAAIFLSPWLDLMLEGDSLIARAALDPLVTKDALCLAATLYIGNHKRCDPLLFPLNADLRGLPPMLIHVGDHEVLLSDSLRLAKNATSAGVPVRIEVWLEMWHFFHAWADLPEAQTAVQGIAQFLHWQVSFTGRCA